MADQRDGATLVRNLCPNIPHSNQDRVDFVARGVPFGRGLPYAADVTVVSPLHADGTQPAAANFRRGGQKKKKKGVHPPEFTPRVPEFLEFTPQNGGELRSSPKMGVNSRELS